MLQYLVIQLCDTSVSYCHYNNPSAKRRLIPLDVLREGILWAMKENLTIQFVFPDYTLPNEYLNLIESIDHCKIKPLGKGCDDADIVVVHSWNDLDKNTCRNRTVVLRTEKKELFCNHKKITSALTKVARLNVVITDIHKFTEEDFNTYKSILRTLTEHVKASYVKGRFVHLNLLTDRMLLDAMNNCNAGWESVALAPDGQFYPCPAFYLEPGGYPIGDVRTGLSIKNPQLYRIGHAPICRKCDAYQCRRCVWINRKTTLEINTPSYEQCVVSHLERNASRQLLSSIRAAAGEFLVGRDIPGINYLDPFDIIKN